MATVKQIQKVNRKNKINALWAVMKRGKVIGTIERMYHGPKCYLAVRRGQVFEVCSTRNRAVGAIAS